MDPTFPEALSGIRRTLAAQRPDGAAQPDMSIVPDLSLGWDTDDARITIDLSTPPTGLLRLRARVQGLPRWLSMSIALGTVPLAPDTTLGLVAHWQGPAETDIAARLRSRLGDRRHETALGRFNRLEMARTQVLLHDLYARDPATWTGARHKLILDLPPRDFDVTLLDMCGLQRPARSGPPRLRPDPCPAGAMLKDTLHGTDVFHRRKTLGLR